MIQKTKTLEEIEEFKIVQRYDMKNLESDLYMLLKDKILMQQFFLRTLV